VKPKPTKQKKTEEPSKVPIQAECIDEASIAPTTKSDALAHQGQKRKRPADSSQDSVQAAAQSPSKKAKIDEQEADEESELDVAQPIDAVQAQQGGSKAERHKQEEDKDEGEAFEEMDIKQAGTDTKPTSEKEAAIKQERDTPVLTIYLSMTPMPELAAAYGEQSG